LPAENHQQRQPQHKARNGIAGQHDQRAHQIEARTRPHRLGHAQRHAHQVADEKSPQPQADGHRQLLPDELPHILVLEKAAPQIEARKAAEHLHEALRRGFVEPVELADFGQPLFIHPLRAAVAQPLRRHRARAALEARAPRPRLRQILLHRPARHELNDRESHQQHAQQRGQHEQNAFEDVGEHGLNAIRFT